jgi:hypothetical protein
MDILCNLCIEVYYVCCICCFLATKDEESQSNVTASPLSGIPPKRDVRADSMYSVGLDDTGSSKQDPLDADPCSRKEIGTDVL